jgi:hypothetical protein
MLQSFDFATGANVVAIQEAGKLGVQQSIIPLIELTRFVFEDYTINELGEELQLLTGESFRGSEWAKWYKWLGEHPELEPLAGYVTWKGDLYSQIDGRFASLFVEEADRRIPMWAIQWGGVGVDGIPPLENPTIIRAMKSRIWSQMTRSLVRSLTVRHEPTHEVTWHPTNWRTTLSGANL